MGWWFIIDASTAHGGGVNFAHHICGILATISFIMINTVDLVSCSVYKATLYTYIVHTSSSLFNCVFPIAERRLVRKWVREQDPCVAVYRIRPRIQLNYRRHLDHDCRLHNHRRKSVQVARDCSPAAERLYLLQLTAVQVRTPVR